MKLWQEILILPFVFAAACTDYVQEIDDQIEELRIQQNSEKLPDNKGVESSNSGNKGFDTISSNDEFIESSNGNDEIFSSSEEIESSSDEWSPSSSEIDESSSSAEEEESSSSNLSSSSSEYTEHSSSSEKIESSSSVEESSSSKASWAYLNPAISYGEMIDDRDGQVYKTVVIGEQTWMAENLNFDPGQGGAYDAKYDWSWCYKNEPMNCEVTGRFYTWAAAIDSAKLYTDKSLDCGDGKTCTLPDTVYGICPPGWHLPSQAEWETLFTEVGEQSTAGNVLKSQTGWIDYNGRSGNGTNAVGFSALPVGRRYRDGRFNDGGLDANFWTSTEDDSDRAYQMGMDYSNVSAHQFNFHKYYGFSVRCMKN